MRRVLIILVVLLAAPVAATVAIGASGPAKPSGNQFTVELDNAFGLTNGADVKVAGVRAGTVTGMRVDPKTTHALIDFKLTETGFGSLRKDVFCETRPQSLIGEYFVDCRPGTSSQKLAPGATIPIKQTASTIPADLVNDIMRQPYRDRLRIILDELGGGVGGRAGDINAAIRRAVPALRETDQVLAILAKQNQTLADLTTNADTVIGDLAANRHDVGRFVTQAHQTAAASAERRQQIQQSLQKLPTFLNELTPTMAALGQAADANTPSLVDLNASAGQLTRLFKNVPPFAKASQTGFRTLADASDQGRPALAAAKPTVAELAQAVAHLPEVANNLAIILAHLNDRKFAVEKDPRSPGGQGYTGFEAILQYLFDQTQAINIYDANTHILKVDLFASKCSNYQNLQTLKEQMQKDPSFYSDCAAILGPKQPGITQADPTATQQASAAKASSKTSSKSGERARTPASKPATPHRSSPVPSLTEKTGAAKQQLDRLKQRLRKKLAELRRQHKLRDISARLRRRIEQTLHIKLPKPSLKAPALPAPAPSTPAAPAAPQQPRPALPDPQQILDFLLGP
jgi:phospholipid/cholesterol/gamma-HCH transport system substrate-binding protein